MNTLKDAVARLRHASRVTAFTGAGISVESGIPPFRGPGGLWEKYDPQCLDLQYFIDHPLPAWAVIREIFYDFFGAAQPNAAHQALAQLEQAGKIHQLITQNIDQLHQRAGQKRVIEFHGTARRLTCLQCGTLHAAESVSFQNLPPTCIRCGGVLKPQFVFFGEGIPEPARSSAFLEVQRSDAFLVIGTTGEVMPACMIPTLAKARGAVIIEVNPWPSNYTEDITDVFLEGQAGQVLPQLAEAWLAGDA